MTATVEGLIRPLDQEPTREKSDDRGQELYDLAQTALMGYKEGQLPENVIAVYGEAAGDSPKNEKLSVTPGLHVLIEGLGTIAVEQINHYIAVHLRAFDDEKANEHHYLEQQSV